MMTFVCFDAQLSSNAFMLLCNSNCPYFIALHCKVLHCIETFGQISLCPYGGCVSYRLMVAVTLKLEFLKYLFVI